MRVHQGLVPLLALVPRVRFSLLQHTLQVVHHIQLVVSHHPTIGTIPETGQWNETREAEKDLLWDLLVQKGVWDHRLIVRGVNEKGWTESATESVTIERGREIDLATRVTQKGSRTIGSRLLVSSSSQAVPSPLDHGQLVWFRYI